MIIVNGTRTKFFSVTALLLMIVLIAVACSMEAEQEYEDYSPAVEENPIVTITMNGGEQIVLELEPKVAPNTVASFISLTKQGFYDGLEFHRIDPILIQGGDPRGDGMGGPGYTIKGEFTLNGIDNDLSHQRGVISMARSNKLDSAGSQFFILAEDAPHLDGEYAAFGQVIEGMEVVEALANAERDHSQRPLKEQMMNKVEVDTKGFVYPDPVVR